MADFFLSSGDDKDSTGDTEFVPSEKLSMQTLQKSICVTEEGRLDIPQPITRFYRLFMSQVFRMRKYSKILQKQEGCCRPQNHKTKLFTCPFHIINTLTRHSLSSTKLVVKVRQKVVKQYLKPRYA